GNRRRPNVGGSTGTSYRSTAVPPIMRRQSVDPGAAVLHADVGTFADAVQLGLVYRRGAAIVHAHMGRIAAAVGFDPVLDRIAGDRSEERRVGKEGRAG